MASMDVPADRPAAVPATPAVVAKPSYITWVTLAFMTTASVASLRSAPTMAVYGLTCVFLYLVPAIIFLLPQSLVAAELASGWSGGVFRWVSEGIAPAHVDLATAETTATGNLRLITVSGAGVVHATAAATSSSARPVSCSTSQASTFPQQRRSAPHCPPDC